MRPTTPLLRSAAMAAVRAQVRAGDVEGALCANLMPSRARDAAFVVRALNLEVAGVKDAVKGNDTPGQFRFQFWRDLVNTAFEVSSSSSSSAAASSSPLSPAVTSHPLFQPLVDVTSATGLTKQWLLQLIDARADSLTAPPPATMADLEAYGDATHTRLLYLSLGAVGVDSLHADHAATHIGKAAGIMTAIRGLPFHALRQERWLPDDVLAAHGLTDSDIIRFFRAAALEAAGAKRGDEAAVGVGGAIAPPDPDVGAKLSQAVFDVACVAHSHMDHLRVIIPDVPAAATPALVYATPVARFLGRLEDANFDVLHPSVQHTDYLGLWWSLLKNTVQGRFV